MQRGVAHCATRINEVGGGDQEPTRGMILAKINYLASFPTIFCKRSKQISLIAVRILSGGLVLRM